MCDCGVPQQKPLNPWGIAGWAWLGRCHVCILGGKLNCTGKGPSSLVSDSDHGQLITCKLPVEEGTACFLRLASPPGSYDTFNQLMTALHNRSVIVLVQLCSCFYSSFPARSIIPTCLYNFLSTLGATLK
jgi:hypothetical protein